jgi:tetratricopeptide (TPR) repeat protein
MFRLLIQNRSMKKILLLLSLSLLMLPACTTYVSYQGLRPADVSLPQHIKSVVLVNRYKPSKQNRWLNVVEGIFTGEILFADRRGVEEALAALQNRLQSGPKFTTHIANEQLEGSGTGMFPAPLDQAQVQTLCSRYNADAVIAIEAFDSDIMIRTDPRTRKRTVNGKEIIESFFEATEQVNIKIGWRIYNGKNGAIIDQHQGYATRGFTNTGPTPDAARRGLIFPVQAILQTGREGGDAYGIRVAPSWVNYSREIYTKASRTGAMKIARRKAQRGEWKDAAAIWERLSGSDNRKLARRATYNLAVAYEFMNDYDTALKYARKAADHYNLAKANTYIYILNNRLIELQRLDQQMEEPAPLKE